jgi:crotonobetaine/carnitine-CoA ligase
VSAAPSATFADRWRSAVARAPDQEFLAYEDVGGDITRWTYHQFDILTARVAEGLVRRGVEPGSSIHLALANCPAFVALWLAATNLGAWIVPSDPHATAPELSEHIRRTKPAVGVCARDRSGVYADASAAASEVVVIDEADYEVTALAAGDGQWARPSPPRPRERAAVMFTSGTTGAPKGVVVTQANYAFAGDVMATAAGLQHQDRQIVVLPLFHANAQYYSFASAISVSASVSLIHRFSASGFLGQAARHGATQASLFAAPMRMILARHPGRPDDVALSNCWYAQNLDAEQYLEMSSLLGCRPRQLYGMTETMAAVLTNPSSRPVPDAMGLVTPGCTVDLRSIEEPGAPVTDGTVGEIVVRGRRGASLFDGYLDDPDTTRDVMRQDGFSTGDLAFRGDDGYFYFAGRRGEMLKVSGESVSAVEIENVVAAHPLVSEAAVVARRDEIRDEVPVCFVVLVPGADHSAVPELHDWCRARMSRPKRPVEIIVVSKLPRTSVGKIRKSVLADHVSSRSIQGSRATGERL